MDLAQIFNLTEDYTLLIVAMGAAILGAVSGMVGSFAMIKKQSLLADAISHASLPGVVLAFMVTGSRNHSVLLLGAVIAGIMAASQILILTHKKKLRQDSSLSLLLAVYFGFGMVLLTFMQHNPGAAQAGIETFLFGEAATILQDDVILTAITAGGVLFILLLFSKEFFLIAFDPEYAAASGIPVVKFDILFTIMIVVTIAVGLQMVGVVLMSAMLVLPAAAARQWTNRFIIIIFLAMLFGSFSGVMGSLMSSMVPLLPTGPSIVITASAIALLSILFAPKRGIIPAYFKRRKHQSVANSSVLLKILYMLSREHEDSPYHGHSLSLLESLFPVKSALLHHLSSLRDNGHAAEIEPSTWAITAAGVDYMKQLEEVGK